MFFLLIVKRGWAETAADCQLRTASGAQPGGSDPNSRLPTGSVVPHPTPGPLKSGACFSHSFFKSSPEYGAVYGQEGDPHSRSTRRKDVCLRSKELPMRKVRHISEIRPFGPVPYLTGRRQKCSPELSVLSASVGGRAPLHPGDCPRKTGTLRRGRQPSQTLAMST